MEMVGLSILFRWFYGVKKRFYAYMCNTSPFRGFFRNAEKFVGGGLAVLVNEIT